MSLAALEERPVVLDGEQFKLYGIRPDSNEGAEQLNSQKENVMTCKSYGATGLFAVSKEFNSRTESTQTPRKRTPQRDQELSGTQLLAIPQRHVDFVLCSGIARIEVGVELDDPSHALRGHRDDFLDRAFEAAGITLLRFPVQQRYDTSAITGAIAAALGQR